MITSRHNHDAGYISLVNIQLANTPDRIDVDALRLQRKSEFHVSLMSLKRLAPMLDVDETELVRVFLEYQSEHDLTDFTLTDEYRLVRRGEKVTLVVMVDMPEIEGLFEFLRERFKSEFPTQPTHITLYTLQPEVGIGLFSTDEVENETAVVHAPVLEGLEVMR